MKIGLFQKTVTQKKKTLGRPEENIKIVNYTGSFRPKLDKRFFYPTQCQEWENQISD